MKYRLVGAKYGRWWKSKTHGKAELSDIEQSHSRARIVDNLQFRVQILDCLPEVRFDSVSVVEDWCEGSRVRFSVICSIDNNLWITPGETNNTACSAVKALSEYNAGA